MADPLLDDGRGFGKSQQIWTNAKRFNQSHFIVKNQTPFDAANLVSCRRDVALFRSYVTLRKTKYKYGAVNMMDNGADCVCWTRGLFKEDVAGLILDLSILFAVFSFVIIPGFITLSKVLRMIKCSQTSSDGAATVNQY